MGYGTMTIFARSLPAAKRKAGRIQQGFNRRFSCCSGLTFLGSDSSARRPAKDRVRLVVHINK